MFGLITSEIPSGEKVKHLEKVTKASDVSKTLKFKMNKKGKTQGNLVNLTL